MAAVVDSASAVEFSAGDGRDGVVVEVVEAAMDAVVAEVCVVALVAVVVALAVCGPVIAVCAGA
jgi:hypothetical protein